MLKQKLAVAEGAVVKSMDSGVKMPWLESSSITD